MPDDSVDMTEPAPLAGCAPTASDGTDNAPEAFADDAPPNTPASPSLSSSGCEKSPASVCAKTVTIGPSQEHADNVRVSVTTLVTH